MNKMEGFNGANVQNGNQGNGKKNKERYRFYSDEYRNYLAFFLSVYNSGFLQFAYVAQEPIPNY